MKPGWIQFFFRELSDKWQIPTFVLAVIVAGVGIHRLLSVQERTSTRQAVEICQKLSDQNKFQKAGELARELLAEQSLTDDQKKDLYTIIALSIYHSELSSSKHSPARLKLFFNMMTMAKKDRKLTAEDHQMIAQAYLWENKYNDAISHWRIALEKGDHDRSGTLKRILENLPRTPKMKKEEYVQTLKEYLAEPLSDSELIWGLDIQTELLFQEGHYDQAIALIKSYVSRAKDTLSKLRIEYLQALGNYYKGQKDLAEPALRHIMDVLPTRDELGGKVLALLGKICYEEDRPEEAIAFFDQVIREYPFSPYHLTATIYKAMASSQLNRFEESQKYFRETFRLIDQLGENTMITRSFVLSKLSKLADQLEKRNLIEEALQVLDLEYAQSDREDLRLHHQLLAKIASRHRRLAEELTDKRTRISDPDVLKSLDKKIKQNYLQAGKYYYQNSQIPGLLDRESSDILWQSMLCFEKAGERKQRQEILEKFVSDWPFHTLLPEAMFKLAKIYQENNKLTPAIEYYERLTTEFQRTPQGLSSLIPLAKCYIAQGPSSYKKSEKLLEDMVDDTSHQQLFDPNSKEFRQAMFLLGKLYYYQNRFESSVARLEESIERYPMDRAVSEAKFIIAQSYRKIAEQIETKIQRTNDKTVRSALIKQQAQTLERAGNLYELAIPGLETITSRTKLEETYLQLAYIHSADCLYDLGRYDKSIQGYERVIDRYEQNPIALSSYVQIINSYQKLGQSGKIKAVLERMKWLIKQLPDDTFTQNQGILSKSDWQNWIDWNYESGLITDDPPATLAQK